MNKQENEPKPNSEPQYIGAASEKIDAALEKFEHFAKLVWAGIGLIDLVVPPFERFMAAPLSLAQTLREKHPKITKAVTVGVLVPPVLVGAGYGWSSQDLLFGLSAGSDVWIVECAIAKLWLLDSPLPTT